MKILLTGSSGQLGKSIVYLFKDKFNFLIPTRVEMDLSKEDSCRNYIKINKPSYVINAGAFTNVSLSEEDNDRAYSINALAPKYICEELALYNGKFLQISTDYVFDGINNTPIDVCTTPNPLNFYGHTKYHGELNALKFENSKILRTSWVYSPFGVNFLLKVLEIHQKDSIKKQNIEMVCDQYGSPTSSFSLAKACILTIEKWEKINYDKLHWSDCGSASWYDFAVFITKKLKTKNLIFKEKKIKPIYSKKLKSKLKRPNFSILDCMQTYDILGNTPEHWTSELDYIIDFLYFNSNS